MGTPFPCPDHSFTWLCEGFPSCLRTSHPNSHGKANWKPQKAITLKALCSESRSCLAATARLTGLRLWDTGTQKGFTRGTTPQLPLQGRRGWQVSQTLPLPQVLCLHPTGNTNTLLGARLLNQGKGCSCLFPVHLEFEMSQPIKNTLWS